MMTGALLELTVVILIAAILGFLCRVLKQPVILAYILTGIIVGFGGYFKIGNQNVFQTFAQLGVMLLLFLIGLEINYTSLRLVGKTSVIVGIAQIIFTFIIGFFIAILFNFTFFQSAYISIALTFSSTVIVVKLLSEKRDLNSLYGKITVGFLLVQDFLAILLLIFLGGLKVNTTDGMIWQNLLITLLKGAGLLILMFWLGRKILPFIFNKIAHSEELLFLSSLAWCLGVVVLVYGMGFSIEIGGFLAGLALANSAENFQISSRIRSLRDFFVLIFFVTLGSSLVFSDVSGMIWPIIIFSLFVLIGNPLIVLIIMGLMGYKRRTGFFCGITVAQISEFSLVLAALGLTLGHLTAKIVSLITAIGVLTILSSTYMIIYSEELFQYFKKFLAIFERQSGKSEILAPSEFEKNLILIGFHRIGQNIAANLKKTDLLIIDFDPEVINHLRRQGYTALFGDIADIEILERANFKNANLIISTSPDFKDNLQLLNELNLETEGKNPKKQPKVIVRARDEDDAEFFYKKGADYVLLPHFTSGQYLGRSIAVDPELKILSQLKNKDLELIKKMRKGRELK